MRHSSQVATKHFSPSDLRQQDNPQFVYQSTAYYPGIRLHKEPQYLRASPCTRASNCILSNTSTSTMKEPWIVNLPCCCCCKPKQERQPKPDLEHGDTSSDNSISPAERAIDIALRHESSSRELEQEQDIPEAREANPPPSYDSVLKDDDRRTPRPQPLVELNTPTSPCVPPPVHDSKGRQPQESVFSDEDDVVITPPTTASPTVIDEDSEDERINGTFRGP